MRTGWEATKLGAVAFIVPFVFVFSPSLLAQGTYWLVLVNFLSASLGVGLLSIAIRGFLMTEVNPTSRLLLFASAIGLFLPVESAGVNALFNIASLIIGVVLIGGNVIASRLAKTQPVV